MRRFRMAWMVFALAMVLVVPATAVADVEPNDGITQVEGPLTGGTVYNGTLPNDGDQDWYVFYVTSQTQLDITATTIGGSPCGDTYFQFLDTDGYRIDSVSPYPNQTEHIKYTTPVGTTRFLLKVSDGCSDVGKYQFTIQPAASVVPGPGVSAPVPTPEPNETADQAFGPLTGGVTYAGTLDTSNDQDWFYFFTSGTTPFDLAITNISSSCPSMALYRDDSRSDSIDSRNPSANAVGHVLLTPTGPLKYLVQVKGYNDCLGATYQLRVDPPGALAAALPAPVVPVPTSNPTPTGISGACRSAKSSVRLWKGRVAATTRSLRRARRARSKRALRAKLKRQKRQLTRARDNVAIHC